jgi:hypothetical protein
VATLRRRDRLGVKQLGACASDGDETECSSPFGDEAAGSGARNRRSYRPFALAESAQNLGPRLRRPVKGWCAPCRNSSDVTTTLGFVVLIRIGLLGHAPGCSRSAGAPCPLVVDTVRPRERLATDVRSVWLADVAGSCGRMRARSVLTPSHDGLRGGPRTYDPDGHAAREAGHFASQWTAGPPGAGRAPGSARGGPPRRTTARPAWANDR